jgi:hypothetical protein
MTLDVATYTEAITTHSAEVATAASGHLDEPIEHCPGWTMVELVQHLTEVQWFWATVVEQRLQERPNEGRPTDIDRADLIGRFSHGAQHLARVLGECDQATRAAAHAAGVDFYVDPAVAADSIEEFLTFSVSNDDDPIDPPGVTLGGSLGLTCTDVDRCWTIRDGDAPSTVRFAEGIDLGTPHIAGTSSDILMWLYSRVELESDELSTALGARFRALCFTD